MDIFFSKIGAVHSVFFLFMLLVFFLDMLCRKVYAFITDGEFNFLKVPDFLKDKNFIWKIIGIEDLIFQLMVLAFLGFVCWPLLYIVLAIAGILLGLRKAVRFSREVKGVINNKADKVHTHKKEDIKE